MKRKLKGIIILLAALVIFSVVEMPVYAQNTVKTLAAQKKDGLVKENGKYHYYTKGKLKKKAWVTIKSKKYYFKANGDAAVGSYKISGKYYIFDANGQLCTSKKTVVTVNKVKYGVNKKGEALTGTQVINETFYAFSSTGKYDATKTKKLRSAAKYEKSMTNLYKLIGKPKKSKIKYVNSCYGNGKDGILKYTNFTVYTYKDTKGKEIFMGVE